MRPAYVNSVQNLPGPLRGRKAEVTKSKSKIEQNTI